MARRRPPPDTATLWFHPRDGIKLSVDKLRPPWTELARVRTISVGGRLEIDPSHRPPLPRGYLWANPDRQRYGLGGPYLLYGPIGKTCRDCKEPFVFTAGAQRGLYEDARADLSATQVRCPACVHRRRELEAARVDYAAALRELERDPSGANHASVAQAVLRMLDAGGRAPRERAIGHCRTARRLGVDTSKVERRLVGHR